MFVVVVVSWKNERRFRVRAPKGRQVGVIFGREVRQRLRITFSLKPPQDPGVTPVRIQEGRKTAHLPPPTHTHTPLFGLLADVTHLQITCSLRKQNHILTQGWNSI